jgi:hypothetical protein
MTAMNLELRRTIGERAPLAQRHPRGRGFGILSRLARAEDDVFSTQREATILAFEPRQHTPRHRRDDI